MATIPIASLSPSEPPPADQSIRAIVSLLWPYSSSTKQCALLLAERDFRLRNHRGQIRVRFQGASAQAVAQGQVGIGDEVVLELRGSAWAAGASNVATPGKSVEGELLFRGQLAIRLVKKADGREADVSIQINDTDTTPPPEDRDANTTPARPTPLYLRTSLGGADVVPIYSSPAFVRRMRLSGGNDASWVLCAHVDRELEADLASPRKKQKISFGDVGRWKLAARTPSPETEDVQMTTNHDAEQNYEATLGEGLIAPVTTQDCHEEMQANIQATSEPEVPPDLPTMATEAAPTPSAMAPPPLPRLEMPDGFEQQTSSSSDPGIDPHTPKLQPVPSSALPLPSPFPAEVKQLHTGVASLVAVANEHQGTSLAEEAAPHGKDAEVIERSGHVPLPTEASQDLLDAVEEDEDDRHHPVLPGQPSFSSSVASTVPPEQASGGFHDFGSDDVDNNIDNVDEDAHVRRHRIPHPEYESDTEEDEELYSQYTQQRDAEVEDAVRRRDGPDLSDHVEDDDVEEVIDDMGEPPDSDEEASETHPHSDSQDIGDQPQSRPSIIEALSDSVDVRSDVKPQAAHTEKQNQAAPTVANTPNLLAPSATPTVGDSTIKLLQVGSALSNSFGHYPEAKTAAQTATQTPTGPGLFSLDGAAESLKARTSTPQSERDRLMKRTYSSLFGFAKSPSPERALPSVPDFGTPTPASSSNGLSRIANDRFAAAGISVEKIPLKEVPVPSRAKLEETQGQAAAATTQAAETPSIEVSVPARATIADTMTLGSDLVASTISIQMKQMPVPARATVGETQSSDSLRTASKFSTQEKQMPVPHRATIGDTQSSATESAATIDGAEHALEIDGGTIPKSVMKDDSDNALLEPAAATEETGQTSQLGDVGDGSLPEAVHNAAPNVHEEYEEDKFLVERSSVVEETPIERLQEMKSLTPPEQGRLQAEYSAPEGVAINPGLAAAMPSGPDGGGSMLSASSAPRPSQVEVIDLGDSSDDEDEVSAGAASAQVATVLPSQPADSTSYSIATAAPATNIEGHDANDNPRSEATERQQDFERLLSQAEVPRHRGNESITQISQGSMLHSDMLDTTQTTVDGRSEIATPYMDEYDTIVPDTSHEESIGVFQGQPNFFDDQMHGQEFEGNAAPQSTQNTANAFSDRYSFNLSFQSATSVATDNSDHYQANAPAREGVAGPAPEETSMQDSTHGNESQVTVLEAESPSIVGANTQLPAPPITAAEIYETTRDQVMSDSIISEHHDPGSENAVDRITEDVEMHDRELRSSFSGEALTQYPQRQPDLVAGSSFEESPLAAIVSEDFAANVRSVREAAQLAESQLPQDDVTSAQESPRKRSQTAGTERSRQCQSSHHTGPHSTLPISPEDSQHRLESQPFETQLPFETAQSALPPTPQLTQGDPLTEQGPEVIVNPATGDSDLIQSEAPPPTSPRQTRSSRRGTLAEGLQSPKKKEPIRRSPRKAQVQSQELQEAATRDTSSTILHKPATRQSSIDRPITPPPRPERSQESVAAKKNLLSPTTQTPVRRSPRKTQAQLESQEQADSWSVAGPEGDERASDRNSTRSTARAPITRSAKKATGKETESQGTTYAMEDEVAVRSPSTHVDESPQRKRPARRSMTSRISAVPAVISNWFSPRRSTRAEPEAEPEAEPDLEADIQAEVEAEVKAVKVAEELKASPHRRKSTGIATQLSYYTSLSNIRERLNVSSQTYGSNAVDVMAVVIDETSKPQRAKSGPRDHFTVFKITDPSLDAGASTGVEVFKHWHATLPSAQVGDVILLRSFLVRSKRRQPYLLSGDESAWCVWRYAEEEASSAVPSSQKGTPTKPKRMRDRNGSFSIEIKGPPVEYNRPQERERAEELRAWWLEAQGEPSADVDADAVPSSQDSPQIGRRTRSQQKL